jgi:hypothetical protein
MLPRTTRSRTNRHGSSALEFALIAPVLLTLMTGIMDYSWYMTQRSAVVFATQDGARGAVIAGSTGTPIPVGVARVKAGLTQAGFDSSLATVTVTTTGQVGEPVIVTTVVPFKKLVGLVPTPPNLAASATMLLDH